MRSLLVLLYLSVALLSWALAEAADAKNAGDSFKPQTAFPRGGGLGDNDGDETTSDVILEENPDYVPVEEDEDSNDSDSDDEYDSDEDEIDVEDEDDDAKGKLSKTLKKAGAKSKSIRPLKALTKNRGKITIALALFAFRREIFVLLLKLLGRSTSKNVTTDVLKLLLFLDFMRRMQQSGGAGDDGSGGSLLKTIGALIDRTMDANPAYVPPIAQHFAFESLNEYYLKDGMALQKAMRTRHKGLKWPSSSSTSMGSLGGPFSKSGGNGKKKTAESESALDKPNGSTAVILDWTKLDEQITSMNQLRQQVSFLLSEYRGLVMKGEEEEPSSSSNTTTTTTTPSSDDEADSQASPPVSPPPLEIVVLLESPGGSVAEYGLAGQYLLRLRNEPGITLTICVDKIAASGGYLLCCTASPGKLYAAPFALLGSIGVIATQLNVNRLLKNYGVEPLEFRGGKYKAPIGLLGKVSKAGKRVTQTMIDDIHKAFKQHVADARPVLKDTIDEIGNGNVWLGTDAIDLGLADALQTSEEYIEELIRDGTRVFKMVQAPRSGFLFGPRLGGFNTPIESRMLPLSEATAATAPATAPSSMAATATSSHAEDVEGLLQKSKTAMLRLPAHAKSLFSKSLQSCR